MKNNITQLEIKNFKSIQDVKLDCKRINVFIGEPNVGKSNILEALTLYIAEICSSELPILKEYIRYEKLSNLFYDQDRKRIVCVKSNIGNVYLRFHLNSINSYDICVGIDNKTFEQIQNASTTGLAQHTVESYRHNPANSISSRPVKPFYYSMRDDEKFNLMQRQNVDLSYNSPIKRYIFKPLTEHKSHFSLFLRPPHGDNLFTILESNPTLYDEVTDFFLKYNLDLLLDTETGKLDVQKRVGNRVYKIPYSLAADTLQRIIFHLAAIETNTDSILLLEEPEAHSFPLYISLLAEKIVKSKNNQFFIATHSPYLLTPFIEQCTNDEVAIFICKYENYETKVRALSKEEIDNIMETGIDLFYNIPAFQK
jgi:AAA15 family ATPase/GTPase